MDKLFSMVKDLNGTPALFINDKPFVSVAYMTYLEEYNDYKSFAQQGYNFFSAPVLFSGRWINVLNNTPPFKKGIFDVKGSPDYLLFDKTVEKILAECPEAYIFPRVNISMPEWWEKENPDDVNITSDGTSCRESLYSLKWRKDAAQMLRQFVEYVNNSAYSSHIVGYQIAGGNTEEWFHFDMNAGYCKNAEKGFNDFLRKHYPDTAFKGLPDISELKKTGNYHNNEYLAKFLEYAGCAVADAISYFASVVKNAADSNVVTGTFYGYSLEVPSSLYGTHALKILLNDKNIDFISSPCSYYNCRNADADWTEMFPADSVRLHGKMCFQECDIRTNLTTLLSDRDISLDPEKCYISHIWKGPETKEESLSMLRKTFCRQLIKGNGLWWFDMWGGWFSDSEIMKEMKLYREIYAESLLCPSRKSIAEIAAFADESAYKYLTDCSLRNAVSNQREALGCMGTPYDIFDICDFEKVKDNYKAVVFMSPVKTEYMKNAVLFCTKNNIPFLMSTEDKSNFTVNELRAFCKSNSVKIYCETNDILYINENYVAVYSTSDGMKEIFLDEEKTIIRLLQDEEKTTVSDKIQLKMKKGETVLFRIK